MKQFIGKYSKPSSFLSQLKIYIAQEKVKTFKETVSFHLASNHSHLLNHDCTSTFSIFALYQPGINIAHNACGHYGKIQPGVLANHSERYIFTSSSHIIILQYNMLLNQFTPTVQYILFLFSLYGEESHEVE